MSTLYPRKEEAEYYLYDVTKQQREEILADPNKFIREYFYDASPERVLSLVINRDNVNDLFAFEDPFNQKKKNKNFQERLLIMAIRKKQNDLVEWLLSLGADPNCLVNLDPVNRDRYEVTYLKHVTALTLACNNKSINIVENLLKSGANPNLVPEFRAETNRDETPTLGQLVRYNISDIIHLVPKHPLTAAFLSVAPNIIIQHLMAYGADINFDNGSIYSTPLYGACRGIIYPRGFSASNKTLEEKLTTLENFVSQVAVANYRHPIISYIIDDMHFGDREAAFNISKMLLEYCLDPNLTDEKGYTMLDKAFVGDAYDYQVLLIAAKADLTKCKLLHRFLTFTVESYNISNDNINMARFLIENNFANIRDIKYGLLMAQESNKQNMVAFLATFNPPSIELDTPEQQLLDAIDVGYDKVILRLAKRFGPAYRVIHNGVEVPLDDYAYLMGNERAARELYDYFSKEKNRSRALR